MVGYSNAKLHPVLIWADPAANVPQPVRAGVEDVLSRAVNLTNRKNKRAKFGFRSSEDAVTWTFFRCLQAQGQLDRFAASAQHAARNSAQPKLFLWGVAVPSALNAAVEQDLELISRSLGEDSRRRTEPDVVIDFEEGVLVVEVKLNSGNERLPASHPNWRRYLDVGFVDSAGARATELYELTRNWRFAVELAKGRPFTLVNLGRPSLFNDAALALWGQTLDTSKGGQFFELSWSQLLGELDLPSWMADFASERGLLQG